VAIIPDDDLGDFLRKQEVASADTLKDNLPCSWETPVMDKDKTIRRQESFEISPTPRQLGNILDICDHIMREVIEVDLNISSGDRCIMSRITLETTERIQLLPAITEMFQKRMWIAEALVTNNSSLQGQKVRFGHNRHGKERRNTR
jgi:hypothetical protein